MIESDIQKLDPGALVQLFALDLTNIGGSQILRFHAYTQSGSIFWQGEEYSPWPIDASDFARVGEGTQPTPTLSVGNIGPDGSGVISALCLALDDLVGARLTRHRTLAQYLDAANFPDGNPSANPDEHLPPEIWIIEQKTSETPETIEFELSSALDFSGQKLPGNQIIANSCGALRKGGYRGYWCGYTGAAMFDKDGNPVTSLEQDKCGGRVSDCKLRFGEYEVINFVGAPSADRLRGY